MQQKKTFFQLAVLSVIGLVALSMYLLLFRRATFLEVTLKLEEVPSTFFYEVRPGMLEKDALGRTHVEVVSVEKYPSPNEINTQNIFVIVKLRAVYSRSTNSFTFNSRPVLVGNLVRTNPGNVLVEGKVVNIAGQPSESEIKKVLVETQVLKFNASEPETLGALEYIADSVVVGDEILDSQGNVIATVREKRVVSAQRTVVGVNGSVLSIPDPVKKDIFLTFEMIAEEKGGKYFIYNDYWLAIDTIMPIEFPHVKLYPTVTSITELE